jgi:hypothetical protein
MVTSRAHSEVLTGGAERRRFVAVLAAGLLASGSFALVALGVADGLAASAASACGPGGEIVRSLPGPVACVHEDVPPPGVDVTERVSTRELLSREGAGPSAYDAAEELGVPTAAQSNATTPAVSCEGDGTGGYRVQAMYVVEAGRTNRFAELQANLKLWAAGVDDVVNRSAALSGGVRNVRFVTEAGAGSSCEAKVLNVTVPAGSLGSFNSSISAVQALGYTDPSRKYLMWTDTTVLCGVASMYLDDQPSQANANNGRYAQYARTDSGCWGFGNGTGQHSVEAHELLHTLGGVQRSAPNSTAAGHCTDESDTMCYVDGAGVVMRSVCPPEREYLFDCNTNDYFSTYPDPGGYLDTHWNSADSRFLLGGGDGSGGGSVGSPTTLGATIGVNNPAVPGLSTQVGVTPALPSGRTLATVTWKSARSDCAFSTPTELQSDVTCGASATGSTTVTATLVDSSGATKTITSPLTFSTGAQRPVSAALTVAGQSTSPASVCTGAAFPVQATVTDVATGQPVKGLSVTFTKQTPTTTAPGSAGSGSSAMTGLATVNGTATVATTYAARTTATARYATATATALTVSPGRCSPVLEGEANRTAIYHGETVTVSGTLTRSVDGAVVPVSGASLPVKLTYASGTTTKVVTLATAKTLTDGSWTAAVKPTASGDLSVALAGSASYAATTTQLGALAVHLPSTELTAAVDRTEVGYGDPLVVTGRLTKTSGALTSGSVVSNVAGATVTVKVAAPGKSAVAVGSGRTLADGTFRLSVPLRTSGTMTVVYAGATGVPADSVDLGAVTASPWTSAITVTGAPYSTGFQLTGTVTKSYGGATKAAGGVRVKVYFTPTATGVPVLVTSVSVNTSGSYAARVYPRVSGSYQSSVSGVAGYTDSTSGTFSVTR